MAKPLNVEELESIKLINQFQAFFSTGFEATWQGFLPFVDKALKATWTFWREGPGAVEDGVWAGMLSMYKDSGMISQTVYDNLYEMRKIGGGISIFAFLSVMVMLAGNYLVAVMAPAKQITLQQINKEQRPSLPGYSEVIQAAFTAPEKTGQVRELMMRHGLKDADIDLLFLANYRLYDVTTIRDLYRREHLTEEEMFVRMRELGFTDTRTKEIIKLWEVIPTPQDLFFMVAKEAFEPDMIEKIGLGDEFPEEQVKWLEMQGINSYWAHRYWYAHWNQPSVGQGYQMLHRGEITYDELDMLFRAVEMPPFWREKLTAIAYHPYTRVDVRRMHDSGTLNDAELLTAYTDLGFDNEKATKMAEFTVAYNLKNNRELTKTQIINSYIDGLITRTDAKDLLITLKYPEAMAEFNIVIAEFQRDLGYQDDIVKNIRDRYLNNLIDKKTATNKLNEMNLPAVRVTILIDKWALDKFEDIKIPSKTDLQKMFLNGFITEDDYASDLKRLGYNPRDTALYIQLTKLKQ